jgi:hypothetical protein
VSIFRQTIKPKGKKAPLHRSDALIRVIAKDECRVFARHDPRRTDVQWIKASKRFALFMPFLVFSSLEQAHSLRMSAASSRGMILVAPTCSGSKHHSALRCSCPFWFSAH